MEHGPDYFQRCLDEFRPRTRSYDWIWKVLRWRMRARHGFFPDRYYRLLSRAFDPARPYFIGETADGARFLGDTRELYAVYSAVQEGRDEPVAGLLRSLAKGRPGACLDIGTNMGLVAASVARSLGEGQELVAFEPVHETARRAAATFALNGLRNVRLFECALGDEDCELTFYAAPNNSEWASITPIGNPHIEYVKTTVPCRSLDSLRREGKIGAVSLMKIDVEGFELNVLRGARETIGRDTPNALFEYNWEIAPTLGWAAEDAAAILSAGGRYAFRTMLDDGCLTDFPPERGEARLVNIVCECVPEAAAANRAGATSGS